MWCQLTGTGTGTDSEFRGGSTRNGRFIHSQVVLDLQGGPGQVTASHNFLIRDFNRSEILDQRSMLYFLFYFYIMMLAA